MKTGSEAKQPATSDNSGRRVRCREQLKRGGFPERAVWLMWGGFVFPPPAPQGCFVPSAQSLQAHPPQQVLALLPSNAKLLSSLSAHLTGAADREWALLLSLLKTRSGSN